MATSGYYEGEWLLHYFYFTASSPESTDYKLNVALFKEPLVLYNVILDSAMLLLNRELRMYVGGQGIVNFLYYLG